MRQDTLPRRQAMLDFDHDMRARCGICCGVDEAGRGPLAGDVFAAAVILTDESGIVGLDDSKKLSEKRREALYLEIKEKAAAWCIATASVAEIEELNILEAAMLAMRRAVEGLQQSPAYAIVDGNRFPKLSIPGETVVKGDATSAMIAAASILAKVERDHYMMEQAVLYPEYAFAQHKGYGTAQHRALLQQYGPCPIHRMSFLKKIL